MKPLSKLITRARAVCALATASLLCSCGHSLYSLNASYEEAPPTGPVHHLPKGKTPKVVYAIDVPALTKRYEAAGYAVIGTAHTTGTLIPYRAVADFAESKGACVVLTHNFYKGMETMRGIRPVTESVTSYHSGSISSYSPYAPSYSYTGTSTSYRTRMQEYTYQVESHSQFFIFLAPRA